MAYTKQTWVAGTTSLDQPHMSTLETQYDEASASFPKGMFNPFVLAGLTAAKDGTTASKLNLATGTAFPQQADGTLRRRDVTAQSFTTVTASTTYFLDLNPDGTLSWGTAHSAQATYVPLCSVATDASGNIATVTDARPLTLTLMPGSVLTALSLLGKPATLSPTASHMSVNASLELTGYVAQPDPAASGMTAQAQVGTGLGVGAYNYAVTFLTDNGESFPSTVVAVTTTSGNQKVQLSGIPTTQIIGGANPNSQLITGRNLYRTKVGGGSGSLFLLATLSDTATTTFADTTADTGLGAAISTGGPNGSNRNTTNALILRTASGVIRARIDGDGLLSVAAPPVLLPGNQETGYCGGNFVTTAASQSVGTAINFKTQLTTAPTSLTFSAIASNNVTGGPTANSFQVYGANFFVKSTATGTCGWIGSYSTVGNTIRAVDTAARTFDHHCDHCDTLRERIPLAELRAQTSDGGDPRVSLPGHYSLAYDCVTPGCGTTEVFNTGLSATDEQSTVLTVDGTLTEGAKARLIRQAQRALGVPVLP